MSRSTLRTLIAATMVAAVLVTGCSLIPGLGDTGTSSAPPAAPASKPATSTPAKASAKPAVSKTTSGTAVPVPGLPAEATISSDIDGIELRDLQAHGALVVDLQAASDFKREHIDGAESVPMSKFTGTAWGWPRERSVVLYDRTGAAAQGAQNWLERRGFARVYHLFRGIEGYDDALVGKDPRPIPPREPVLYYFYASSDTARGVGTDAQALAAADTFAKDLKNGLDGEFEYHAYDVSTIEGLSRFLEFGGTSLPMFRLVTEKGQSEQFTGSGTMMTVRSHLERAIVNYREIRD